jgi:uncharacterized protein (TIGR03382 family)
VCDTLALRGGGELEQGCTTVGGTSLAGWLALAGLLGLTRRSVREARG